MRVYLLLLVLCTSAYPQAFNPYKRTHLHGLSAENLREILKDGKGYENVYTDPNGGVYITYSAPGYAFVGLSFQNKDQSDRIPINEVIFYGKGNDFYLLNADATVSGPEEQEFTIPLGGRYQQEPRLKFEYNHQNPSMHKAAFYVNGRKVMDLKQDHSKLPKDFDSIKVHGIPERRKIKSVYQDMENPNNYFVRVDVEQGGKIIPDQFFYGQPGNLKKLNIDRNRGFPKSGPYPYHDLDSGKTFVMPGIWEKNKKPYFTYTGNKREFPLRKIENFANFKAFSNGEQLPHSIPEYVTPFTRFPATQNSYNYGGTIQNYNQSSNPSSIATQPTSSSSSSYQRRAGAGGLLNRVGTKSN